MPCQTTRGQLIGASKRKKETEKPRNSETVEQGNICRYGLYGLYYCYWYLLLPIFDYAAFAAIAVIAVFAGNAGNAGFAALCFCYALLCSILLRYFALLALLLLLLCCSAALLLCYALLALPTLLAPLAPLALLLGSDDYFGLACLQVSLDPVGVVACAKAHRHNIQGSWASRGEEAFASTLQHRK